MRSTVDIQNAIDSELRTLAKKLGSSYKDILNRVIALGLPILKKEVKQDEKSKFKVQAKDCGPFKPGIDELHFNRIFDELGDK